MNTTITFKKEKKIHIFMAGKRSAPKELMTSWEA